MADSGIDGDSPLSIASNITGILTFAISLIGFVVAFFKITLGAENEILKLHELQVASCEHIVKSEKAVAPLFRGANEDYLQVRELVDGALGAVDKATDDIERFIGRFHDKNRPVGVGARVTWWFARGEAEAYRAQLNNAQQALTATLLVLNLKYVGGENGRLKLIFKSSVHC